MMLHADIANFSRMARNHAGYLDYGQHDSVFSWKQEMSAILGHDTATKIVEQKEREEAMESLRLHYDYENMTLNTKDCCRAEVKQTLDVIADRQPQLQLYHTKGETYWEFKGKKEDVKQVDIYRLQAPDGYCFDYEHDLMENEDGVKHKTAHVKFIVQKDENKQGNGIRMQRHVHECTDVLFKEGFTFVWGLAARMNQFEVRHTRHGENWRSKRVRIRDAHGVLSTKMIRLLACYLRSGWILLGKQKENDEQIAYFSPKGIEFMVEKCGNESLEQYRYSKKYEEIITRYKE